MRLKERQYEQIAHILKHQRPEVDECENLQEFEYVKTKWNDIVEAFAAEFALANDAFDRETFLKACSYHEVPK